MPVCARSSFLRRRLLLRFEAAVPGFERLLLLKALREDKLLEGVRQFVATELGEKFAASPAASMEEIYADLDNATPCIFILSKGADPTGILLRFAKTMNYQVRRGTKDWGAFPHRMVDVSLLCCLRHMREAAEGSRTSPA